MAALERLALLLLLLAPAALRAGFASPYLTRPMSARSASLGGAGQADLGEPAALWSNPALMACSATAGVQVDHLWGVDLENADLVTGRLHANDRMDLGFLYYYSGDSDMGRDATGRDTGGFTTADNVFGASAAFFMRPLSVGITLKGLYEQVQAKSGMGVMADLGVNTQWRGGAVDLGLALQNMGMAPKVGDYPGDPQAPFTARLQASERLLESLQLFQEARVIAPLGDSSFSYCEAQAGLGVQWGVVVNAVGLDLRAGYDSAFVDSLGALAGIGVGFGVSAGDFRLDYAYQPLDALGHAHRLGLNWRLGGQAAGRDAYQAYQGQARQAAMDATAPPGPPRGWWDMGPDDFDP